MVKSLMFPSGNDDEKRFKEYVEKNRETRLFFVNSTGEPR